MSCSPASGLYMLKPSVHHQTLCGHYSRNQITVAARFSVHNLICEIFLSGAHFWLLIADVQSLYLNCVLLYLNCVLRHRRLNSPTAIQEDFVPHFRLNAIICTVY